MIYRIFLSAFVVSFFSSCVSTKSLYKGLNKEPATLAYLYDKKEVYAQKTDTILIEKVSIADKSFTKTGDLVKTKSSFLPLIIYTGWKNEHEYYLGEQMMREDLSDFIQQAAVTETNRSTILMADSVGASDLSLEITVEKMGAHGPYLSEGNVLFLFVAYSYSLQEAVGPGLAYSTLAYELKRGDEVLYRGMSHHEVTTEPMVNNYNGSKQLRKFFTSNLVEGISLSLKVNIAEISQQVENYIISHK